MRTTDFFYDLPPGRIAQSGASPRDSSRLMVCRGGTREHRVFSDIVEYLRPGDVLVLNDTKVIPARLRGLRPTGGAAEILLLRRIDRDSWEALVRPGRKLRKGATVFFGAAEPPAPLLATIGDSTASGGRMVSFAYEGVFEELLDRLGTLPLPPYITERLADPTRYQTVYARVEGSAAAPTAGLHFTPELLARLEAMDVAVAKVLLHVGLGTFRPVKAEEIEDHEMHAEWYSIKPEAAEAINAARARGGRIVCVGTTSVRALESAATEQGLVCTGEGWTNIFITPGYRFRAVDALVTNFHLPGSTLLMLVAAFMGDGGRERLLEAYHEAIEMGYRFYSLGDAMLII